MDTADSGQFCVSAMLSVIILIVPYSLFYNLFIKVLIVAIHEKDHFDLINSYPRVFCKEHLTKTKQYSTSEDVLVRLADRHPIVNKILEFRGLKKLLSTYVEALPTMVNPKTGKTENLKTGDGA